MKTKADFIRFIKNNKVEMKKVLHYGKTIDEIRQENENSRFLYSMENWRKITKIQSNGFEIEGSFLDMPNAKQLEFTGDKLRVYRVGYRPLNDKELKVLKEWEEITKTEEYKRDLAYDLLTDYDKTYRQKKWFFIDKGFNYLRGFVEEKGLKLVNHYIENGVFANKTAIRDNSIKGDLLFEYDLRVV